MSELCIWAGSSFQLLMQIKVTLHNLSLSNFLLGDCDTPNYGILLKLSPKCHATDGLSRLHTPLSNVVDAA